MKKLIFLLIAVFAISSCIEEKKAATHMKQMNYRTLLKKGYVVTSGYNSEYLPYNDTNIMLHGSSECSSPGVAVIPISWIYNEEFVVCPKCILADSVDIFLNTVTSSLLRGMP